MDDEELWQMEEEAMRDAEDEAMREAEQEEAAATAGEASLDPTKKRLSFAGIQRTPAAKRGENRELADNGGEGPSVPTPKRPRTEENLEDERATNEICFVMDDEPTAPCYYDEEEGGEAEGTAERRVPADIGDGEGPPAREGAGDEPRAEPPLDEEPQPSDEPREARGPQQAAAAAEEVVVEDYDSDKDGSEQELRNTRRPQAKPATRAPERPSGQRPGRPAPSAVARAAPTDSYYRRQPFASGSFMTVTGGPYDERAYVRCLTPAERAEQVAKARGSESESSSAVLGQALDALVRRADTIRLTRALARSEREANGGGGQGPAAGGSMRAEEGLWVQKYAPRCFADLLSDDATNRGVLQWLKEWDPLVFNKKRPPPPVRPEPSGQAGRRFGKEKEGRNEFGKKGKEGPKAGVSFAERAPPAAGEPEDTRPSPRIILLAGPPGLGKTTLAHVAARQAGYRVLEINASDDRSGETLKRKLLDATEMKAMFAGNRPNCVVLDEIDGALEGAEGKGAISTLLKIVHAGDGKRRAARRADAGDDDDEEAGEEVEEEAEEVPAEARGRRGGKKGARGAELKKLCRPIICVCNDAYVPALRPLRMEAQVFHFRKPTVARLARRLKAVCAAEGMPVDPRALTALCEMAECDVRTCLNTLQFVRSQQNPAAPITTHVLARAAVGQKDVARSHFAIWQAIFEAPKRASEPLSDLLRSAAAAERPGERAEGTERQRHWRAMQERLYAHGEAEKVLDGLHENLHTVGFSDPLLTKAADCLDWLCTGDILHKRHAAAFAPFPALAVHYAARTPDAGRARLAFPSAISEARHKARQNGSVVRDFVRGATCAAAQPPGFTAAVLDVLPALLRTLAVSTKKGNVQLLSGKERGEVQAAALRMADYGLSFRAGHGPDGAFAFFLDPAVDALCTFGGRCEARAALDAVPDRVKSLLATEAEAVVSRRAEAAAAAKTKSAPPPARPAEPAPAGGGPEPTPTGKKGANPLARYTVAAKRSAATLAPVGPAPQPAPGDGPDKAAAPAPAASRGVRMADWMGLSKKRRETVGGGERKAEKGEGEGEGEARVVRYRFHEGFTNAVRRTVLVKHLL